MRDVEFLYPIFSQKNLSFNSNRILCEKINNSLNCKEKTKCFKPHLNIKFFTFNVVALPNVKNAGFFHLSTKRLLC